MEPDILPDFLQGKLTHQEYTDISIITQVLEREEALYGKPV